MTWVLTICTQAFLMCGQIIEVKYPDEPACYRALDELYRRNDEAKFKYVLCKPDATKEGAQ